MIKQGALHAQICFCHEASSDFWFAVIEEDLGPIHSFLSRCGVFAVSYALELCIWFLGWASQV